LRRAAAAHGRPLAGKPVIRHVPVVNNSEMHKIGYAKVSTPHQNLDRQIGALRAERCDEVFRDKGSAKHIKKRPQLEKAIDTLGTGDVLVVAEWDRATRSMSDGVSIIDRISERGALIKVRDKPHLDLTTPIGRGFIAFLPAMAEDDRERILRRANDGRKGARASGSSVASPRTDHRQWEAPQRLEAGDSARSIAKFLGVHRTTVLRVLST